MTQKFFVARGQSIRGPVTNRKRDVNPKLGKVQFSGTPGPLYEGKPDQNGIFQPLPDGFIDFARNKKESNGQTLLQNLIEGGQIVYEAGAVSPVQFAQPLPPERVISPNEGQSK